MYLKELKKEVARYFLLLGKQSFMPEENEIKRNRPSNEGRRNDPDMRDESAIQPGVQTISPSSTDEANQNVTRSAMDGPELTDFNTDANADPTFDEVDRRDDL